jgi:hypothetical protein
VVFHKSFWTMKKLSVSTPPSYGGVEYAARIPGFSSHPFPH